MLRINSNIDAYAALLWRGAPYRARVTLTQRAHCTICMLLRRVTRRNNSVAPPHTGDRMKKKKTRAHRAS